MMLPTVAAGRETVDMTPEGTISCKFWGLSDGTVGANKLPLKLSATGQICLSRPISPMTAKIGRTNVSHLRFGKTHQGTLPGV